MVFSSMDMLSYLDLIMFGIGVKQDAINVEDTDDGDEDNTPLNLMHKVCILC